MDAQGYPKSSLGVVSGGSWGSPGALLSAPGLLWDTFWTSWGGNLERLGMIFLSPGDAEGETSEKLEFDDPLNENAMFLRSQGLQNETLRLPKPPQETFWTPQGTLRALWGWFREALGALLGLS